jgi:catechol 2,3-dioxygenase-like lactoylglutathione lyase family enzyme
MKLESGPKPDLLKGDTMLQRAHVATGLPVEDLHRARDFYAQRLGLEPTEERPGGLLYGGLEGELGPRGIRVLCLRPEIWRDRTDEAKEFADLSAIAGFEGPSRNVLSIPRER